MKEANGLRPKRSRGRISRGTNCMQVARQPDQYPLILEAVAPGTLVRLTMVQVGPH